MTQAVPSVYIRHILMTDTSYRTYSGTQAHTHSPRLSASRDLRRFISDVIDLAGGPHALALDLQRLGYVGRDGPYSEQAVRTWRAGARIPASDLLFALARRYQLSLDDYALSEDTEGGSRPRHDRLREALWELVEADLAYDEATDTSVTYAARSSDPGGRRAAAMNRARELLPQSSH